MKFQFLSDNDIARAARALRIEALGGLSRAVPTDLEAIYCFLSERDSVSVDEEADLPDENGEIVLGKMVVTPRQILVNRQLKKGSGRHRFTLAHEIGHWELHRAQVLANADSGQSSLPGFHGGPIGMRTMQRSMFSQTLVEEVQANKFASELLMDREALQSAFRRRFPDGRWERHVEVPGGGTWEERAGAVARARVDGSLSLAEEFGVSGQAMGYALLSRKLITSPPSLFE